MEIREAEFTLQKNELVVSSKGNYKRKNTIEDRSVTKPENYEYTLVRNLKN